MTSSWSDKAYKGGPMVDVPGFPRPLYPPDANASGKQPSSDGPDVIAYKRTVSRAGRWPWQTFDDSFSNGFAHGSSGDVAESGVAGVQRQQKIDATGWIGEKTFNTLRSIRVPDGFAHAGEMAMDAYAQSLIVQAWQMFHGAPAPSPGSTSRAARINEAKIYVGIKESPANSNNQQFGSWYGMNGVPWCAIFVCYVDQHSQKPQPATFVRNSRYSYVPYMVTDARNGRCGLSQTNSPEPGDITAYDWEKDGTFDHCGIFEGFTDGSRKTFTAIEGNTSIDSNSDGGQVMRRTRNNDATVRFLRVAEP